MDSPGIAAPDRKVAGLCCTRTQEDCIEVLSEFLHRDVATDAGIAGKLHPFVLEKPDTAHHDLLLIELHVGNPVHEESSGSVGAFKNRDAMSRTVELRGGTESASWTRTLNL